MLRTLSLMLLCAALGACERESYSVAVRNVTPVDLDDAYVRFDGFESVSGTLSPGIFKVTLNVGLPLPETATVEWREPDGRFYLRVVEVRKVVPPDFTGLLFFEILPNGEVRVVARETIPPLPPQPNR